MDSTITPILEPAQAEVRKEGAATQAPGSFFPDARNFEIKDGVFTINNYPIFSKSILCLCFFFLCGAVILARGHVRAPLSSIEPVSSGPTSLPDILKDRVALNAILNDGGRAEDPKCYPGTREQVIGIIETWIDTRDGRNPILWLSGPAGAGKTAIMKTIAERSSERNVHTINVFFFRDDPTRNSAHPLVATILYQIFELYPAARQTVATILSVHPLLLDASIQVQFNKLIFPLFSIMRESSPEGTPIVLLVDGLDECDIGEDAVRIQVQVLRALDELVTSKDSPFIALVATRPEPHIDMAFNQLSSRVLPIFLNVVYRPDRDILRFVIAKFREIKRSHPKAHMLPADWPPITIIEWIVRRSSGQFIYAATVMRFLESPAAFPKFSFEQIEAIIPRGETSPFAPLDSLYIHILNRTADSEATLDILSADILITKYQVFLRNLCSMSLPVSIDGSIALERERLCAVFTFPVLREFLSIYNSTYTDARLESSLLDLAAIVRLEDDQLVFYHADFSAFLLNRSKSHKFHIDLDVFTGKAIAAFWKSTRTLSTGNAPQLVAALLLRGIKRTTPDITDALLTFQPSPLEDYGFDAVSFFNFLGRINLLYYPQDVKSYRHILQVWASWAVSRGMCSNIPLSICARSLFEMLIIRPIWLLAGGEDRQFSFIAFYVCLASMEKGVADLNMIPTLFSTSSPGRDQDITTELTNNT